MKEGIRMNQKREVRTVSLIGLGAIGCFLASHLGPLMGDNLLFPLWSMSFHQLLRGLIMH